MLLYIILWLGWVGNGWVINTQTVMETDMDGTGIGTGMERAREKKYGYFIQIRYIESTKQTTGRKNKKQARRGEAKRSDFNEKHSIFISKSKNPKIVYSGFSKKKKKKTF